jgi:hypothetical protein
MTRYIYQLTRSIGCAGVLLKRGVLLFDAVVHDFGNAANDTVATSVEHRNLTLDPRGGYPTLSVARTDVERIGLINDMELPPTDERLLAKVIEAADRANMKAFTKEFNALQKLR